MNEQKAAKHLRLNESVVFGNDLPFVLVGGMNVLESHQLAMEVAEEFVRVCEKLHIPYVFKA